VTRKLSLPQFWLAIAVSTTKLRTFAEFAVADMAIFRSAVDHQHQPFELVIRSSRSFGTSRQQLRCAFSPTLSQVWLAQRMQRQILRC
jgi:hypothetical protein